MTWTPLRPELAELEAYVPKVPPGVRVRLDANEAPRAPDGVAEIVREAMARVPLDRYPDPRALALKAAIAKRTGAREDELVVGCGSDEVIAILMAALARPRPRAPHPVVMHPTPTFVMYAITARAHGWKAMAVPLDAAWDLDVSAFERALGVVSPNVLFVASPNNPTGNRMSDDRLERLLDLAGDAFVVVDEAYVDYAGRSVRGLREGRPRVGILRTLSKMGLAALRVGWLEADVELVREIDKARQPFNLSTTSQAAAAAALEHGWEAIQALARDVRAERARLGAEIAKMDGFSVTPSDANFLWVEAPGAAGEVFEALASRGVLVRSFHAAGGRMARRLRVTVGSRASGDELLEALRGWRA